MVTIVHLGQAQLPHFPLCSLFLRSILNLWGEAIHNSFSMKNGSSEKDKVKWQRSKRQSLLRPCWNDFLYDFFPPRGTEEDSWIICSLYDSPEFSAETHFSPQRVKQLLRLVVITENEDEKGQDPKTPLHADKPGGKKAPAVVFSPLLSLLLSSLSIFLLSFSSSSTPPILTDPQATQLFGSPVRSRVLYMLDAAHKDSQKGSPLAL